MLLQHIEAKASHGFRCRIGTQRNILLFPRVGAMSLDTPERVKYFCLKNTRSCGICRLRSGRSVIRAATRHNPIELANLYSQANVDTRRRPEQQNRKRARDKLSRHGWKPKKKCKLNDFAQKSLIHITKFGGIAPPYGGLIQFEKMHVFFIGYCTYCMEELAQCVPKSKFKLVAMRVRACHQFRDPITGLTHPRLPSVLKMTHLTAERRVRALFYWGHVLGPTAECVEEEVRAEAQTAVATLQLLLIATRGHRSYSEKELDIIFVKVGGAFFRSLEAIAQYNHDKRIARAKTEASARPFEAVPRQARTCLELTSLV